MKAINKYISINNNAKSNSGELYIYGDIASMEWWEEDVTPQKIKSALDELGAIKSLNIHINSNGGEVVAGNAIVNIIDTYKAKNKCPVNVYIEGIAASMASGIAMVGDKVYMADNSLFMIHKPLTMAVGNANDFEKEIEILNKVEETLISNYMRKFNGTEEELKQMLSDETWLTAQEAKVYGFVDEITKGVQIAASAKGVNVKGVEYTKSCIVDRLKDNTNKIKEDNKIMFVYDEKFKDFGIDENMCEGLSIEAEKLMEIANIVKDKFDVQKEDKFEQIVSALETDEEMTVEKIVDYVKAGMNPPTDKAMQDKATAYDKIVDELKQKAIANALKAQGDNYNETITKKMLDVLSYDEIVIQNNIWENQAKERLNAGRRMSMPETNINTYGKDDETQRFNEKDYKFE